ncbi:MAG: aldehyde ferredoxin oxidoreductase family protein [Thermodesulfobacteriota bacterium]
MNEQYPGGYNGKVLRVSLSTGSIESEAIDSRFCRKYIGGAGFIAHYLLNETEPGVDPLGPLNKLIFATGPLTGIALGGCARHTVGSKSPLTGGIVKSEVGEHWGFQFKRAGFDALIIEGQAKRPVYLWIYNGEAEIRDAAHLWGKSTKETQDTIRTELDDPKIRVAMIGPGGENKVHYACIMHGLSNAAGRGGLGAVMGSKNLKAVAVKGNRFPAIADKSYFQESARWLKENMSLVKGFSELGTGASMENYEAHGYLPVRNFRDSAFPDVVKISPKAIKETIGIGMKGCFACPVKCKKVVEVTHPYSVNSEYGGPEYETLGALGSACGVTDLKAIAKGSELCDAYSLDTISTGMTIAFAMECFEKGILTLNETEGIELKFGNAEAMLKTIEKIANREGIGNLLAQGSLKAAEHIGNGAEAFAMQVKRMEIPMHEPRLGKSLALGFMVNPHGADHMDSLLDPLRTGFGDKPELSLPEMVPLGYGPVPSDDIGPKTVALNRLFQIKRFLADSLVLCDFLPYSVSQYVEMVAAATGWQTTAKELFRIAERILTMCRLYNVGNGFTDKEDRLPERFFSFPKDGAAAGKKLDREEMERAKRYYYTLMGWHENGVPRDETLDELGIDYPAYRVSPSD